MKIAKYFQNYKLKIRPGFTLLELLIIMSIITILATVILVAVQSARYKAMNAKIEADLSQIKISAEADYKKTFDYSKFFGATQNPSTCQVGNEDLKSLCNDIIKADSQMRIILSPDGQSYAVEANLLPWKNPYKTFCVDNNINKERSLGSQSDNVITSSTCP